MDLILALLILGALCAGQLMLCLRARCRLVRLLPCLLTLALMTACAAAYVLTDNWAWLIVLLLLFYALAALGIGWMVFGLARTWKNRRL